MKKLIFLLLVLSSCEKDVLILPSQTTKTTTDSVVSKSVDSLFTTTSSTFNNIPGASQFEFSVSSTIHYFANGKQHIVVCPGDMTKGLAAQHFIKNNGVWEYEGSYPEGAISAGRNYSFMDNNGTIAICGHGVERSIDGTSSWPYGDIKMFRTVGDKLKWTDVSTIKSFYHSIGSGDFNGDGSVDIVGLNMGSRDSTFSFKGNTLHAYSSNGTSYTPSVNTIPVLGTYHGGAVMMSNLFGDSYPEIVMSDYGFNKTYPSTRYSFVIFGYDNVTKNYKVIKSLPPIGIFADSTRGATSIKSYDVDKDNNLDIIVATEANEHGTIQVWYGDGVGNFTPGQVIDCDAKIYCFREFEVSEYNGKTAMLLHACTGSQFRKDGGVYLSNAIWVNEKDRTSKPISSNIFIKDFNAPFMKGFYINGKITYIGFETYNNTVKLTEVILK